MPASKVEPSQTCVFFICEQCDAAAVIANAKAEALLEKDAATLGFHIGKRVIEMQGTCADCLLADASSH